MTTVKLEVPKFSSTEKPYERYKVELSAWSLTTTTEKEKQGLVVALSLPEEDPSNIRDKVFSELEVSNLNKAEGLKTLTDYLDKQFGRDDLTVAYERYIEFERCKRKKDQKVNEFILEFEQKYNACTKKGKKYPDDILAMKIIDSCNLSPMDQKLVLSGIDYSKKDELFDLAKKSLRKFHGEQAGGSGEVERGRCPEPAIKLEAFISENEEALVARGWRRRSASEPPRYSRTSGEASNINPQNQPKHFVKKKSTPTNPIGPDGKPKRCFKCDSIMHLKPICPHVVKPKEEEVVLFTGNNKDQLALLAKEAWDSVVLDSACSKTVCGLKW